MTNMNRTAPFFGRGVAFPLRLSVTGGLLVTDGSTDAPAIAVQYLPDGYTLEPQLYDGGNHIAESVAHILQVIPGERDTLPEFGSRINDVLFDPNDIHTQQEFETWVEVATERWERRASIPIPGGIDWKTTAYDRDRGESRPFMRLDIIRGQVAGNLVAPFVSERQAREAHYPLGDLDATGHDWCSRYRNSPALSMASGERYIRPRQTLRIDPAPDDEWYETTFKDTWLLVSHKVYGDFRLWWVIADAYAQDAAAAGVSRSECFDVTMDPEPGTLLRIPSRARALMEIL